jgi:hypothetical protein
MDCEVDATPQFVPAAPHENICQQAKHGRTGRTRGRRARGGSGARRGRNQALEDFYRVQVAGVPCSLAGRSRTEGELSARGRVRSIAQKIEAEERVVVEDAIRSPEYRLAVAAGVESDADARLKVVSGGLNAFLQPQGLVGGPRQRRGDRLQCGRQFDVVTQAIVESYLLTDPPGILPESADRSVVEGIAGAAQALDHIGGNAGPVRLNRRQAGTTWKSQVKS